MPGHFFENIMGIFLQWNPVKRVTAYDVVLIAGTSNSCSNTANNSSVKFLH